MNVLPTTKREWLQMVSLPFKAYIFGAALLYPYWNLHMPGRPGAMGGGDLTEVMTHLASGYGASCAALFTVAIIQIRTGNRREAMWNFLFAAAALICGQLLTPPLMR